MRKVAIIVEGKGDVKAVPSLICKIAAAFGEHVVPSDPPIRGGEARKLKREGELERFLRLASSRENVDEIFVVVDLDDGCPKEYSEEFTARASAISHELGKLVHVCFCIREYEGWFLSDIQNLSVKAPEYGIPVGTTFNSPEKVRGAKELLGSTCKLKGYKQMRDQLILTKKLDVKSLTLGNRSFRKLVKEVTLKNYAEITELAGA